MTTLYRTADDLTQGDAIERRYAPARYRSNWWYAAETHTTPTAAAAALNRHYTTPVWLPGGFTIERLAVEVTTLGGAGAVVRAGLYADDYLGEPGLPGSLLLDAGTVSSTSTGVKEWTVSELITTPGWYWLSVVAQVAACSLRTVQPLSGRNIGRASSAALALAAAHTGCIVGDGVTGALPATWAPFTGWTATLPLVVFRGSQA
jgi:hypothetical protein